MFGFKPQKCLQKVHSLSIAAVNKTCYYYVGRLSETEICYVKKAISAV